MRSRLLSRKFLISIAAFLASLGTGIAGLAQGNETVAIAGGICCVVSGAIYAACEAAVDAASASANSVQTVTTNATNITATSASQKVVEKALAQPETKSEE